MRYLLFISILFFLSTLSLFSDISAQDGWYTEGDFKPTIRVIDLYETWVTVVDPTLPPQPEPSEEQLRKFGGHLTRKETNGHAIHYQLDDIDRDGIWDDLFFMSDFKPGEIKVFYIYIGESTRGMYEHETHAEIGNYGRHNVPIWESKQVGWKLWYPTDVDLLMKPRPVLVGNMEDVLNISGYNVPVEFGIDGMTVSNTFGAGGICLFEYPDNLESVSRPRFSPYKDKGPLHNTRYAFDVVYNGPLRSTIRAHTMNWTSKKGIYELTQYYTAYKNKSYSTCKVVFNQFITQEPNTLFGCGIRAIMNEDKVYIKDGVIISFGKDVLLLNPTKFEPFHNKVIVDFEGIALVVKDIYNPQYQFIPLPRGDSANEMMELQGIQSDMIIGTNHTFRLPVTKDLTFEYLIAAAWSKGYVNKSAEEFKNYVTQTAGEYNNPIRIKTLKLERKELKGEE
jgi:hypothetical protein